mgnify:CR=1 FL=1|tara:strand:+ start:4225 stop:5103 length:879 start_codon:yes stop_codon:yes gene_type:complete
MITNENKSQKMPKRCVIFGSNGFIGKNLVKSLKKETTELVEITSNDINLTHHNCHELIQNTVKGDDVVIILSAMTPDRGKDIKTMMLNIKMMENLTKAIKKINVAHIIYFSSDAVYSFDNSLISESIATEITDYYSAMHIVRETIIKTELDSPILFVRPTLVYGIGDTHNSYGPNRFVKNALQEKTITLGGQGEETQDHIYINDLVNMIKLFIYYKTVGTINLATGNSYTFMKIANIVNKSLGNKVNIIETERKNEITYRKFDISNFIKLFPDFIFSDLEKNINFYIRNWKI